MTTTLLTCGSQSFVTLGGGETDFPISIPSQPDADYRVLATLNSPDGASLAAWTISDKNLTRFVASFPNDDPPPAGINLTWDWMLVRG
jgi:hypothetical protein